MAYWFTIFYHWLLQIFAKNAFFGHFGDFQAGNRPNSSTLLQSTWQHAFLSTSIAFYDISARACAEIKKVTYVFRLKFNFFAFLGGLSFLSFSFLIAAVIDVLLGLLPIQKILRKHNWDWQFLACSSHVVTGKFAQSFSLHWADHSDLGVNGEIFSSCRCCTKTMINLIKGADFSSGTKAKARHGQLLAAQELMG